MTNVIPLLMTLIGLVSIPTPKNYEEFKIAMLSEINGYRLQGCNCGNIRMNPVPALTWNDALAASAAEHAIDMYQLGYFDHKSKDGRNFSGRIKAKGYDWELVAENIAFGQKSIPQVVSAWMASPGHCRNVMNPGIKHMGVAKKGNYWVQDLGAPKSTGSNGRINLK